MQRIMSIGCRSGIFNVFLNCIYWSLSLIGNEQSLLSDAHEILAQNCDCVYAGVYLYSHSRNSNTSKALGERLFGLYVDFREL